MSYPRPKAHYDEHPQSKPINKAKITELHEQFQSYKSGGLGSPSHTSPWTQEAAITLGALYFEAWGRMPTSRYMNSLYGLMDSKQITKLFGTYAKYHEAIQERMQQDACSHKLSMPE